MGCFMWLIGVWISGCREQEGRVFLVMQDFAKACDLHSAGMIAWVVVLHWLRLCDYSFCYSVCYQQTVFIVSLCGCVFPIVLFITVFVLSWDKKLLIVISGFTCIYKCTFLIIIFNLSSFFCEKQGKVCSELIC